MSVGISDISVYLPGQQIAVDDIVRTRAEEDRRLGRHLMRAQDITGQQRVRFPEVWEDPVTMAAEAARVLLDAGTGIARELIRHLVVGIILHHRLGPRFRRRLSAHPTGGSTKKPQGCTFSGQRRGRAVGSAAPSSDAPPWRHPRNPLINGAPMAKKNPNIVLILADNLGWGELGCYGGGILRGAPTPRIVPVFPSTRPGLLRSRFRSEPSTPAIDKPSMSGANAVRWCT